MATSHLATSSMNTIDFMDSKPGFTNSDHLSRAASLRINKKPFCFDDIIETRSCGRIKRTRGKKPTEEDDAADADSVRRYLIKSLTTDDLISLSTISMTRSETSDFETEDDMFCNMLAVELNKVTKSKFKRSLKRQLMNLVYDVQEQQDDDNQQERNSIQQQPQPQQHPNKMQLLNSVTCGNKSQSLDASERIPTILLTDPETPNVQDDYCGSEVVRHFNRESN